MEYMMTRVIYVKRTRKTIRDTCSSGKVLVTTIHIAYKWCTSLSKGLYANFYHFVASYAIGKFWQIGAFIFDQMEKTLTMFDHSSILDWCEDISYKHYVHIIINISKDYRLAMGCKDLKHKVDVFGWTYTLKWHSHHRRLVTSLNHPHAIV